MTAQLGQTWEILSNGHKPYACGVVLHPLIDGVIALRAQLPDFEQIASIAVQVNPIMVRITGIEKPQTGLQSKFSLYHSAAIACLDGVASLPQYGDARAADPKVIALRDKVQVQTVEDFGRDEAHVCITLKDGTRLETHIDHASGTQQNPMTDSALQTKFMANAEPVLGIARSQDIMQGVWELHECADVNALTALCAGSR